MTFVCNKYKCSILGYVIMPNHVHFIIYFNESNNQLSRIVLLVGYRAIVSIAVRLRICPLFQGEVSYFYIAH
ncbi:transposase [Sporocytophaga sp.]|uniref:transposase n=1 Tax=Sporocytophaga sp. TaxID=2231183 RepID=UPI00345C50AE